MLRRLSRNTLILLISNVGTAFLAFLLTVLIGRGLGDVGLGHYATVMAWIFPLTILADFGMGTLITRDVAQKREQTMSYIQQALWWRWTLGGSVIALVWIFAPFVSSDTEIVTGLRIASFLIGIDSIFGIYTAVWRAWEIMWPILILNVGLLVLQVLGTGIVLWQKGDLQAVFMVLVIADAVQLAATWGLWRWHFQPESQKDERLAGEFLQKASPFAIAGILTAVYARLIFLLLETQTSPEVVGWFAAASRFIEAAKMPIFALFGAVFPMMSALEPTQLQRLLKRVNRGLMLYGVGAAVGFTLLSDIILELTFGHEFQNAATMLVVLGFSLIPFLIRQNLATVHYALRQEKIVNWFLLAILPIQSIVGVVLIRNLDGEGAAWTVLCTEGLLMVWLWWSYANRDSDTGIFRK